MTEYKFPEKAYYYTTYDNAEAVSTLPISLKRQLVSKQGHQACIKQLTCAFSSPEHLSSKSLILSAQKLYIHKTDYILSNGILINDTKMEKK